MSKDTSTGGAGPEGGKLPPGDPPPTGASRHRVAPRPKAASAFMAVPVLFGGFLLIAGVTVVALGWMGGTPEGERLELRLEPACAPETVAHLIEGRAAEIGLGAVEQRTEGQTIVLVATMPGLADDAQAIPALLTRPGTLELRSGTEVLAQREDVEAVSLRLDESGLPYTHLSFKADAVARMKEAAKADPDGVIEIYLDGQRWDERPNGNPIDGDAFRLLSGEGATRARMRAAADIGIVLMHGPLPCDVAVTGVAPATPAQ